MDWTADAACGYALGHELPNAAMVARNWCVTRPDLASADAKKIIETIEILRDALERLKAKEAA